MPASRDATPPGKVLEHPTTQQNHTPNGVCAMSEQVSPYRCILDRQFIIDNICVTCSQDGKCDYQTIYPVPDCATVDTVERYFETLHSDSHSRLI